MTKTRTNPVAKAAYDARSPGAKRRVGRWNPAGTPYGPRASRRLAVAAPLPTGLELNTVPQTRRGREK